LGLVLEEDVLRDLNQSNRIWLSDGGRITPHRLEFYLHSKQITKSILSGVFSSLTVWQDFYNACETPVAKASWIIQKASQKAAELAVEKEAAQRREQEVLRLRAEAQAAAALDPASDEAKAAAALAAKNQKAAQDPVDADAPVGDGMLSDMDDASSVRSQLTEASVKSVLSDLGSSRRSVLSDLSGAVSNKVSMRELLNLQTAQFGKPGQTMSLKEASMAAECNHACWVFPTNFLIDIRRGSTMWLRPIASVWENGSAWWTCEQVGNTTTPREQWNAYQMVWAMEAYRQENDGSLVHPEDVERRAREELAKMKNEPGAGAGEGLSGKSFTPARTAEAFQEAQQLSAARHRRQFERLHAPRGFRQTRLR
jgi:hypothetical protein